MAEVGRSKLAAAGVEIGNRALVGSDFHPAREEVIREAKRRSGPTEATVYVGDGLWDVRAARALSMPFIGVDSENTGALRHAGVRHVIEGYRDLAAFLIALRDAIVP